MKGIKVYVCCGGLHRGRGYSYVCVVVFPGVTLSTNYVVKTGDFISLLLPTPTLMPMLLAPVPLVGSSKDVTVTRMPPA
jgi:hypothetical protein